MSDQDRTARTSASSRGRRTSSRRPLGALFLLLSCAFAGVAAVSADGAGAAVRRWVVAAAAAALALWMGGLALRALRKTRT